MNADGFPSKNINGIFLYYPAVNFYAICRNIIVVGFGVTVCFKTSAPLPNASRIDQWLKS